MSRDCVTGSNHIRELREVPQPASAEYLSTMREAETNSRLSSSMSSPMSSSMSSSMPWLIPTMTISASPGAVGALALVEVERSQCTRWEMITAIRSRLNENEKL